ncbi:MAG: energy transducer TonB [Alphaproteobacteria bacterium]
MSQGFIYSAVLHVSVFILMWLGLPSMDPKDVTLLQPVPVEVVQIAEETTRLTPFEKPDLPEIEEKIELADLPPKMDPKPVEAPPQQKPDAKPQPPESQPETVAEAAPDPLPAPSKPKQPKMAKKPDPKPVTKPKKPAKKKAKKKQAKKKDDFASVLKNLQESSPAPVVPSQQSQQSDVMPASSLSTGQLSDVLTTSELDALRRQLAQCWNIPAGARDAQNLLVEIRVSVNPDGTVRQAKIVDQSQMAADSFYRTAAESALRAVHHPACRTLKLPPHKYDSWKDMTLRFNPKEMLY